MGSGNRGRPRKSAKEKILEGSRAKINTIVFRPVGAPFVPDHLNEDAQACAEHIINNFSAKHISSLDSYVLAVFAAAWAWHKAAVHQMSSPDFEPVITRTLESGEVKQEVNPWFKIMNEQAKMMISVSGKLFLTPADRQSLDSVQEAPKSKFDGLIGLKTSSASSNISPSHRE